MEQISSRANALMAHIRKLNASRPYRRETGEFPCEGPKLLAEALKWGANITTLLAVRGIELPPLPSGVRIVEVPEELLKSVADTETPQGILFLCKIPERSLSRPRTGRHFLVLDGVQDPGNVGTVWRTADAFGLDGLLLLPGCADPFGPKTVRATMGACFRLPVWETEWTALKDWLSEIPLFAAALREDTEDIRAVRLDPAAVVVGSEGRGISNEVLALCEKTLKIPMSPRCESLNAAVAASVVAWEMVRGSI